MGPREIDFPLPGCPFLEGSLHSSTAAKRSSQGARALEILYYCIPSSALRYTINSQSADGRGVASTGQLQVRAEKGTRGGILPALPPVHA